ncbi:hypothetical protein ACFXKF_36320 [Streptomyces scopuliridis]|uniref:hypothetical protein n=1 Tax=Streptomyces scopuliridis TaxID=452529 RepID=UPI003675702E
MTKKRTTDKQRARELQAHNPRLSLGEALALVRSDRAATVPTGTQARQALLDLAADTAVHPSWRARFRGHLVGAAESAWPTPEDCARVCADLHAAAGQGPQLEWDRLRVPLAMRDMPLPQVIQAIGAMARAAGVKRYEGWFGVQPPEDAAGEGARGPWQEAAQQYLFAVVLAFAGPLRALVRHPYREVPPAADILYGAPPLPSRRSHRSLWSYTPSGLRIHRLTYPRPWGTEAVYGSFAVTSADDRVLLARALLAHALGGTAPGALAACSGCQGTGWLEALDDVHTVHQPHYYRGESSGLLACLCGRCRGSGLRELPAAEFAAEFCAPLSPSWRMSRSAIIQWTVNRLAPDDRAEPAACAPGLQTAYLDAVVDELLQAGHHVDESDDFCGIDFDTAGHLGAWIVLVGRAHLGSGGPRGRMLTWSSDRGWCVTTRTASTLPARAALAVPPRALCPGSLVPTPAELVLALGQDDLAPGDARWARLPDLTVDSYAQVLAYIP